MVEAIKILKWIRVFVIDKRDRKRGILLGEFFMGLWKFKD